MKSKVMKNNGSDERYTPVDALDIVRPFIPKWVNKIWEPTATTKNITNYFSDYDIVGTTSNFLTTDIDCDIIITNPPYSIKDKFLERAYDIGKPFMFLLPITALEGKKRNELFSKNGIQLILPNYRFNFIEGSGGAWFQTSWFCWKCELEKDLNFVQK